MKINKLLTTTKLVVAIIATDNRLHIKYNKIQMNAEVEI